ncbi:MAG: AMP-binding enzyme, partial [Actinomycetota bacterium]
GRPHPEWGQQVVAFVVPAEGDDPPRLEELREHAAKRIARFKLPREIVLGTPNGATNLVTAPTATTWQADSGAYDAAGNTCSNVTITGSGSPRIDF